MIFQSGTTEMVLHDSLVFLKNQEKSCSICFKNPHFHRIKTRFLQLGMYSSQSILAKKGFVNVVYFGFRKL